MNARLLKKKAHLRLGICLWPNGQHFNVTFENDLGDDSVVAVLERDGEIAELHHFVRPPNTWPFNPDATRLAGRPGFDLYGPASLVFEARDYYVVEVGGCKDKLMTALARLALKEPPFVILAPMARSRRHIYVADESDANAIRDCLKRT